MERGWNKTLSPEEESQRAAAETARRERERVQAEESQRIQRMREWSDFVSSVGKRYADATFDSFDAPTPSHESVVAALREYVANFKQNYDEGRGVFFYGPRGTGKDHLAAAAIRLIIALGATVEWFDGQALYGAMRSRISDEASEIEFLKQYTRPNILLISDPLPQTGEVTAFQQSTLWQIVDRRYRDLRPTWVTVNVANADELSKRLGGQLADRLMDSALCLHCNWPTYRKPAKVVK